MEIGISALATCRLSCMLPCAQPLLAPSQTLQTMKEQQKQIDMLLKDNNWLRADIQKKEDKIDSLTDKQVDLTEKHAAQIQQLTQEHHAYLQDQLSNMIKNRSLA